MAPLARIATTKRARPRIAVRDWDGRGATAVGGTTRPPSGPWEEVGCDAAAEAVEDVASGVAGSDGNIEDVVLRCRYGRGADEGAPAHRMLRGHRQGRLHREHNVLEAMPPI